MKKLIYLTLIISVFTLGCSKEDNPSEKRHELAKEQMDVAYGAHPLQKMDVYFPEGYDEDTPVVFLIHGGGFIAGTKENFTAVAKLFVEKGFVSVNLDHRLVEATGLTDNPPAHTLSEITVSDQVQDMGLAVAAYKEKASEWGSGTAKMYMAGHSAGGTLAMLYVQSKENSGLRASGNFAGLTNVTLTEDLYNNPPDHVFWPAIKELLYRMSGQEVVLGNALSLMAISPNWVSNANKPGKPNITIMAESNDEDLQFAPYFNTVKDAENYHAQLRSFGTNSEYILMDTDHGFGSHPEDWSIAVNQAADFFKAN